MKLFILAALAHAVGAATVLQLDGTAYYSPDFVITGSPSVDDCRPNAVVPATYLNKVPKSVQDFDAQVSELLNGDDVFSQSFMSTVIVPAACNVTEELHRYLSASDFNVCVSTSNEALPSGPYFLHPSGNLTRVYRLYADYNMAFTQGVIEGDNGEYLPSLAAVGGIHGAISIPVPSRHYYPKPSTERPLSGLRLGIKDIFDLKGVKTGAGSRAYFELYPPADETASSLQRLIDLGAVVVGKLKTTQFAAGERPTANYVDQLAPFNPRGDGYQSPSGSSCGTGAALASYDWLDFGMGSDTEGSIRGPAMANGIFGMRITNASLALDGIVPISPQLDTPGLLARDAKILQTAHRSWFEPKANYTSFPKRIILPEEFWPTFDETSMATFDDFLNKLSSLLGADLESVSLNSSFVEYTNATSLDDYASTSGVVQLWDQWRDLGEPFTTDYQEQFGRYPFINPVPRAGLALVPNLNRATYDEALRRLHVIQEWYTSQVVTTCEESLVVYPFGPGIELYRDDTLGQPSTAPAPPYADRVQAPSAGVPDIIVPIGTRKYMSNVSLREEELPVSVGIIAGAGCDQMLLDLVVKMGDEMEGFKSNVNTGRTLW